MDLFGGPGDLLRRVALSGALLAAEVLLVSCGGGGGAPGGSGHGSVSFTLEGYFHDTLVFDADGDGDKDVYLAGGNPYQRFSGFDLLGPSRCVLLLNDGKGGFRPSKMGGAAQTPTCSICCLALDWDEDGDLDLVQSLDSLSSETSSGLSRRKGKILRSSCVRILFNDGRGRFSRRMDVEEGPGTGPLALFPMDFDGDGAQDLLTGSHYRSRFSRLAVFLNGKGRLERKRVLDAGGRPIRFPSAFTSFCAADFDGDGAKEILGGGYVEFSPAPLVLFKKTEGGKIQRIESGVEAPERFPLNFSRGDIDGDGREDVAVGVLDGGSECQYVLFLLNRSEKGKPRLVEAPQGSFPMVFGGPAILEDLDGDGDPDCVIGGKERSGPLGNFIKILFNDGGRFSLRQAVPVPAGGVFLLSTGDFNGDGFVDLVLCVPRSGKKTKVVFLFNDGRGGFPRRVE